MKWAIDFFDEVSTFLSTENYDMFLIRGMYLLLIILIIFIYFFRFIKWLKDHLFAFIKWLKDHLDNTEVDIETKALGVEIKIKDGKKDKGKDNGNP